jgi:catechol 2,3-dioxygenase-like lactoylglutathione lyase family enzyme
VLAIVPQRVSLITLGARSVPALRAFYRELGWTETEMSSDSYAVFQTAGVMLSIFPYEKLVKDMGMGMGMGDRSSDRSSLSPPHSESESGGGGAFRGITLAINVDKPEHVDAAAEAVRQAGAAILREPSDAFWGGRTAYFADPEYNVWEIAWNPKAVFDERGAMVSF